MKVLLVAGGSAGHLIPALTLAEHLKKAQQATCSVLSSSRAIDRLVADEASFRWTTVDLQQIRPLWRWLSPSYTFRQLKALRQIERTLSVVQPDVLVGFGGYLSALSVPLARRVGIPVVIHEQNVLPGEANRWLAPFVQAVAVSFPETKRHLSRRARVEVTGNPIPPRQPIDPVRAQQHFGFDGERPVLLVMGGSQGSGPINRWAIRIWEEQPASKRSQVQVLHLAGLQGYSEVETAYRRLGMAARVFPFFREMPFAYTASRLAVSRAGATTIAELVEYRLPALLIPYPYAKAHQEQNALWMQRQGGAMVIPEEKISCQGLREAVESLWGDPRHLGRMRAALGRCADGSAADRLGNLVSRVAG